MLPGLAQALETQRVQVQPEVEMAVRRKVVLQELPPLPERLMEAQPVRSSRPSAKARPRPMTGLLARKAVQLRRRNSRR